MYVPAMQKRLAASAAIVSLSSLLSVGCELWDPLPKNAYFGNHTRNENFVPRELHEKKVTPVEAHEEPAYEDDGELYGEPK